MTDRISYATPFAPSTNFVLECDLESQDPAANTSLFAYYLRAINLGDTSSNYTGSGAQHGFIRNRAGTRVNAVTYATTPFLPSGYATNAQRWRTAYHAAVMEHRDDGTPPVLITPATEGAPAVYGFTIGMEVAYGSVSYLHEITLPVPVINRGSVERFDGSGWKRQSLECWDGSAWKRQILERFDGSGWKRQL